MYEITLSYSKYFKTVTKTLDMPEDTYDAAMDAFEEKMGKQHINLNRMVNIEVLKIIRCGGCGRELRLTNLVNRCVCGKAYNSFGREIQKEKLTI